MKFTFLGHQSWVVQTSTTSLYIDPILSESFGNTPDLQFPVFPFRIVDTTKMPFANAVLITHEHLDHFHVKSIDRFDRNVPIYVGDLMPTFVVDTLTSMGFRVSILSDGARETIGDICMQLFASSPKGAVWETRVHQPLLWEIGRESETTFVCVDAPIGPGLLSNLKNRTAVSPTTFVVSNNSQIPPIPQYSNLFATPGQERANSGVRLLFDLVVRAVEPFHRLKVILICGTGFIDPRQDFGPFVLSNNRRLGEIASELNPAVSTIGPDPGQTIEVDLPKIIIEKADWVNLDEDRTELARRQQFLPKATKLVPIQPVLPDTHYFEEPELAIRMVEQELISLGRFLTHHPVGLALLSTHEHLGQKLGRKRLLLRLMGGKSFESRQYAFDISTASFVPDTTESEQILKRYPYGVEMYFRDFLGICDGEISIWEVAGVASRPWFVGDGNGNVMHALFSYFGEHTRPDLAAKVLRRSVTHLGLLSKSC
jgi:hypothetical protein